MMRKNKLLICALAMSMVMTIMPGMTSKAAAAEGEPEAAVSEVSELQDENTQRLEEVTAMDEDGSIHEIDDTEGTVDEEEGVSGIAMFAARAFSPKVVNFNTKGNAITNYTDETNGISGAQGTQTELMARMRHIWAPLPMAGYGLCSPE